MASNNGHGTKLQYDCQKCPAYCCTYETIGVDKRDVKRLAKHFGVDVETAERRYTKMRNGERVLRHHKDELFGTACMFLDVKTRRCTIYDARPTVCHTYPDRPRCGYFDFLSWEREFQDDPEYSPLMKR